MLSKRILSTILGSVASFSSLGANAPLPFVSPLFSDNMVMQRGKLNPIWGWSTPGREIRVQVGGVIAKTVTGPDGRWQVRVQPPAPGGPYTIMIDGPEHKELHEVLVGDVWLCGGQSNMELPLSRTRNGEQVIKSANNPEIRLFKVAGHPSYSPTAIPAGQWKICSPDTVNSDGGFSAVGYFYARNLQEHIHVPIGLIEDCMGGTTAEAWTSAEALQPLKDFAGPLAEFERLKSKGGPQYGNYIMHWYDEYDVGLKSNTWAAAGLDDSQWKTVQLPGGFAELGVPDAPAVCWLRKEINLPDTLPAGLATIQLGVVERMDTTYINGQWVGASAWVENPRVYRLKPGVLVPGKNVVTVRVFKLKPNGGFMSKPDVLRLVLGDTVIPLAGEWKGALSVDARPPHPLPMGFENWPVIPSVLYEGMIKPLTPLAISGAIWYQGEANADRPYQYRSLLPAMIRDWRKLFGQGDFPFYIVSLPAFTQHQHQPVDGSWADIREAQALTARTVPNCALAVAIDTGDPDNIHPADKEIIGDRLTFCALATHYHEKIPYQGPTYDSLEHLPGALRLQFKNTEGGLVAKNGKLEEFSVAGSDHIWRWAKAKLDGDTIIVSSPEVPNPEAARYAWQSYPAATLYNGANFPAVPFRTDNWKQANPK